MPRSIGDRVRIRRHPFRGHTGTIIDRRRFLGRRRWIVELDVAGPFGRRQFAGTDRDLEPIDG